MSDALLFAFLSFTSYRIWRLFGRDDITEPARAKLNKEGWTFKLVTCPWCLGTWLTFGVVYLAHRWIGPLEPGWVLWAIAASCAVGLLETVDS